jgi:hypothetical protein
MSLERANAVPTADIVYGYKRTGGWNTLIWGVQIDLPFRNRNEGAIGAASADVRSSESQTRVLAAQIEAERQTAQADYVARRQLAQQLIPSIRNGALETLRLAREAYALGGIDLLRLIDAERVYLESEAQYSRIGRASSSRGCLGICNGGGPVMRKIQLMLLGAVVGFATSCGGEPEAVAPQAPASSAVDVDPAGQKAAKIDVVEARYASVGDDLEAAGQFAWNEDRTWSIGVVSTGKMITVSAKVGDPVRTGQILAHAFA